jgi:hypothetical protein
MWLLPGGRPLVLPWLIVCAETLCARRGGPLRLPQPRAVDTRLMAELSRFRDS